MTDKEITELNLKSATYYGAQLQMNHFTEELAELIQAGRRRRPAAHRRGNRRRGSHGRADGIFAFSRYDLH